MSRSRTIPEGGGILPTLRVDPSQLNAWRAWSREFDRISGGEQYRASAFVGWIERNLTVEEEDRERRTRTA